MCSEVAPPAPGCTSEVAQQVLGIPHPIGGRVPADAVFATGTDLPADFFGSAPAIECEFAARGDARLSTEVSTEDTGRPGELPWLLRTAGSP